MLSTILIADDEVLKKELVHALKSTGLCSVEPSGGTGLALPQGYRPGFADVVFLQARDPHACCRTAARLRYLSPETPIIAAGHGCDPDTLMSFFACGVHEFVASPFPQAVLLATLRRAADRAAPHCFIAKRGKVPSTVSVCRLYCRFDRR